MHNLVPRPPASDIDFDPLQNFFGDRFTYNDAIEHLVYCQRATTLTRGAAIFQGKTSVGSCSCPAFRKVLLALQAMESYVNVEVSDSMVCIYMLCEL